MNEEIHFLNINETWTLATLPKGYKPIASKLIYKLKEEISKDHPPKYKARVLLKDRA